MTFETVEILRGVGLALALALIIGVERGWQEREAAEGARIAGIRTFGLIGLTGGLAGILGQEVSYTIIPAGLLAVGGVLVAGYWHSAKLSGTVSATTIIAGLIAFSVGVLAALGYSLIATSAAVVSAILLGLKPTLHGWLERIEEQELRAALRLLLISVVILPLLPDAGYGPYDALNPYRIWWMVVLISGLSFLGYVAVRVFGANQGLGITATAGGLVSSTAITLSFSRFASRQPELSRGLAAGVVQASSIMFLRVIVLVAITAPPLLKAVALPMALMATTGLAAAALLWWHAAARGRPDLAISNPLELGPAITFGALLALISLLSFWAHEQFGGAGLYALAALSGIADVDAFTLSMSNLIAGDVVHTVAARAIIVAAIVNTLTKLSMVVAIAGGTMARYVGLAILAVILAAGAGIVMA